MYAIYRQIIDCFIAMWRLRWPALAIAWCLAGLGWIAVAALPDRYESSAQIHVDTTSMIDNVLRGMTPGVNAYQRVDAARRTLLAGPNLRKVMLLTDMDLTVETEAEQQQMIEGLRRGATLSQQGPNIFVIDYQDNDPAMAKRVVQALVQIFIESNLGVSRKDMDQAKRYLDDKLAEFRRRLDEHETRIASFKRKNAGLMTGSGSYLAMMRELRDKATATRRTLAERQSAHAALTARLASTPEFHEGGFAAGQGGLSTAPNSTVQMQIFRLEEAREQALMNFTPRHPDVVKIDKRLEALRERFAALQSAAPAVGAGGTLSDAASPRVPNPVFEQITLQVVQHEAEIASLRQRLAEVELEIESWAQKADLVPQVEADFQRLTRDYEMDKTQYQELRSRKEALGMMPSASRGSGQVTYTLVDPPIVPAAPSGPNRPAYFAAVLLVSLAAGLGIVFLLTQINATFDTVARLRQRFSLPVLGNVTAVLSPGDRRRGVGELIGFGAVTAGLFAAFGGLMTVELVGKATVVATLQGLGIA